MQVNAMSVWFIEGILLIVELLSIIFVRFMKLKYPVVEILKDPAEIEKKEEKWLDTLLCGT